MKNQELTIAQETQETVRTKEKKQLLSPILWYLIFTVLAAGIIITLIGLEIIATDSFVFYGFCLLFLICEILMVLLISNRSIVINIKSQEQEKPEAPLQDNFQETQQQEKINILQQELLKVQQEKSEIKLQLEEAIGVAEVAATITPGVVLSQKKTHIEKYELLDKKHKALYNEVRDYAAKFEGVKLSLSNNNEKVAFKSESLVIFEIHQKDLSIVLKINHIDEQLSKYLLNAGRDKKNAIKNKPLELKLANRENVATAKEMIELTYRRLNDVKTTIAEEKKTGAKSKRDVSKKVEVKKVEA